MNNLELPWLKAFKEITKFDKEIFEEYCTDAEFADCTFSSLYAWQETFHYVYKIFGDVLVVLETRGDISAILFYKENADISDTMLQLYDLFKNSSLSLQFRYVAKSQLKFFEKLAARIGKKISYSASPEDSDYIYLSSDFLCLDGKANKGKRSGLNSLARLYPELRIEKYKKDTSKNDDCYGIFEKWCDQYICGNCFYGCEKEAFQRFLEVYDENKHEIYISYYKNMPLSFAACEKINHEIICCVFQKNSSRIRGLMYWMNREILLRNIDIKYLNLGEDMGIAGIRIDKSSLHPCDKKEKYLVIIQ